MLEEIAITPQIFYPPDGPAQHEWAEYLRELALKIRSTDGVTQLVVADLNDGSWSGRLPNNVEVKQITDQWVRNRLQQLIDTVKKHRLTTLVNRPKTLTPPPDQLLEEGWLEEAQRSHKMAPFKRMFVTSKLASQGAPRSQEDPVTGLQRVGLNETWSGVCAEWMAPMVLLKQIEKLRTICLHAEWLMIANRFACTTESRFTLEVIAKALLERPRSFAAKLRLIEVHAGEPRSRGEDPELYRRCLDGLSRLVPCECQCVVRLWPNDWMASRVLLAGKCVDGPSMEIQGSPLWGVSLDHVVGRKDSVSHLPANWKLMNKDNILTWYDLFHGQAPAAPIDEGSPSDLLVKAAAFEPRRTLCGVPERHRM